MRVIVLGGGLLGVASAYYLQQLGHEVTVIDRHDSPAAKARGVASASARTPCDAPHATVSGGACRSAMAHLRRQWRSLTHYFLGGVPRPSDRIEHLVRLSVYSSATVRELRREAGVSQPPYNAGWMRIFTDAEAFAAFARNAPRLHALGCALELLSPDDAVREEPALHALRDTLAGAAFGREVALRDPGAFAASMIFMCRAAGVHFLMNHDVVKLHARDGRIDHVELTNPDGERCTLRAQAYVMALGAGSVPQVHALGIDLPLRLVREYSVLLPVREASVAPRVMLHDRAGRLRIRRIETPQGERLRVWSSVRLTNDAVDSAGEVAYFARMLERVEQLLPGVVDASRAEFSCTLQTRSATGLPVIGRTALRNLFLNTAPGAPSWINACGAGKSIARIVSGLSPEVEFAFAKG
jgi:D-amino-acid dehydrogenase